MQGRGPIPFPILMRVGELLAEFVAMGCEILARECNVSAAEGGVHTDAEGARDSPRRTPP